MVLVECLFSNRMALTLHQSGHGHSHGGLASHGHSHSPEREKEKNPMSSNTYSNKCIDVERNHASHGMIQVRQYYRET